MSQIFTENGDVIPVTVIEAGPVTVTQIRTKDKDGYDAVQIGYGIKNKINKSIAGHLNGLENLRHLREFKSHKSTLKANQSMAEEIKTDESAIAGLKRGDKIDVSIFNMGDIVRVSGISKGRGFQGAVKKHGFKGAPASHGHKKMLRQVGSIGQRFPQHTLKGTRMAGHMGNIRVTVRNLSITSIDKESNLISLKGAVPGRK